jgi:hypothetical protein
VAPATEVAAAAAATDQPVESKWVQCNKCSKWRSLPGEVNTDALPNEWYCENNAWDAARNSCSAPEETASTQEVSWS